MKSIFESKTFYLALIQAVGGFLAILLTNDPALQTVGWVAVAKSVVDVIVRFSTTVPVSVSGQ